MDLQGAVFRFTDRRPILVTAHLTVEPTRQPGEYSSSRWVFHPVTTVLEKRFDVYRKSGPQVAWALISQCHVLCVVARALQLRLTA